VKYYIIAGEASGDLHGSNLMKSLKQHDSEAEFRFWGGDKMAEIGGEPVKHISELAFMGFVKVITNIRTIKGNIKLCQSDILSYAPDVLILIDYGGFNMKIAEFAKANGVRVHYYISPKIWASRTGRVKKIKATVDKMFVILPFEVDFYKQHGFNNVEYIGNPILDAIENRENKNQTFNDFVQSNNLPNKPIVALLAGSRKQEIKLMLPVMINVSKHFPDYQFVIAGAPGINKDFYHSFIKDINLPIVYEQTYLLLQQSRAALVTSGTATLETALFRVPEIVCYHTNIGNLLYRIGWKYLVKVDYISLANLIADKEIVRELVQMTFKESFVTHELDKILNNTQYRKQMLDNYELLWQKMGTAGASDKAAKSIINDLRK